MKELEKTMTNQAKRLADLVMTMFEERACTQSVSRLLTAAVVQQVKGQEKTAADQAKQLEAQAKQIVELRRTLDELQKRNGSA